ncbi:hypothetical protein LPUS_12564 [Lasallia pustulata]|uniref:Uncharacterized protein n=1 Tax=Lasallia pustulata TaxID=136370 RepID=A0A1W5DES7_9LECA|nr:hypothetical protein LPUS_12564 [Lasallia pustulata]
MVNVQGMMPPHALLLAIRSRYSAVCFTILATFMGSFLSILVSGLYTIVNVPFIQAMAVQQMDTFDFNQGSLYNDDNLAGTITSLIVHQNLSYPPWTYDNLVFPTVATPTLGDFLDANSSTAGTQAASITVILPAVRASLNCSAVSSNAINMTDAGYYYPESYLNSYDPNDAQLTFNATIPWLCRDNPSNISEVQWVMSLTAPLNVTGALSGAATVLSWSVDASVQGFHLVGYGPLLSTRIFGTLGMGCPSFGFVFASIDASLVTYHAEDIVSMVTCRQSLQEVMTNTTLLLPSLALDPAHPPAPQENTAHYLHNGSTGGEWEFPINAFLISLATPDLDQAHRLDPFMQAIVLGKDAIPGNELVGPAGLPKLLNASNNLYSIYMAQAISENM